MARKTKLQKFKELNDELSMTWYGFVSLTINPLGFSKQGKLNLRKKNKREELEEEAKGK